MERFVAVLLEHCAGNFPLWLTPDQVVVIPISEKYAEYAKDVLKLLENYDIRGLVDERNEKPGKRIRDAEMQKVPFMLVVGENELNDRTVSVRRHGQGDQGVMTVDAFAALVGTEIEEQLKGK
jgi:threonyl-tRNA synthetase